MKIIIIDIKKIEIFINYSYRLIEKMSNEIKKYIFEKTKI